MAPLILALMVIPELLQKWLWMRQLNYSAIFWTLLSVKWGMTCAAFIAAFLFLWINIRQAARNSFALAEAESATPNKAASNGKSHVIEIQGVVVSRDAVMRLVAFAVVGVAAIFLCLTSIHNGTRISASVTATLSGRQTLSLESTWGFHAFVFRFICSCKGVWCP